MKTTLNHYINCPLNNKIIKTVEDRNDVMGYEVEFNDGSKETVGYRFWSELENDPKFYTKVLENKLYSLKNVYINVVELGSEPINREIKKMEDQIKEQLGRILLSQYLNNVQGEQNV